MTAFRSERDGKSDKALCAIDLRRILSVSGIDFYAGYAAAPASVFRRSRSARFWSALLS